MGRKRMDCPASQTRSEQVMARYAYSENSQERVRLAENPFISPKFVNVLVHDENPFVRMALAENATEEVTKVLPVLARDNCGLVLRAVARNTNSPVDDLTRLSQMRRYFAAEARSTLNFLENRRNQQFADLIG